MCFHILYFHIPFYFLYFLYFTFSYPFRVLHFVLSIYCIHILFMYYFHILCSCTVHVLFSYTYIHVLFMYYFHLPIFMYCSFHILFSCYTFHMIVIYCTFHLILSYCNSLYFCDAPIPEGPLTACQPAEYKWMSGYPTPLQKIGWSLLCTRSSTQIKHLHETCPKQSNIIIT